MAAKIDKKIYLAVCAVAVAIGFLIWFSFFFQIRKIGELSDSIQKERLDFSVQQKKKEQITKLKKELNDVQSEQGKIEATLIDKNDAVPLLKSLEDISGRSGTEIKISVADLSKLQTKKAKEDNAEDEESDTKKEETAAKFGEKSGDSEKKDPATELRKNLGLNLEVSGPFLSVADFFYRMENIPYFILVYNMDVVPASEKNQSQSVGSVIVQSGQEGSAGSGVEKGSVKATALVIIFTDDQK